jgi:hypothetical protein
MAVLCREQNLDPESPDSWSLYGRGYKKAFRRQGLAWNYKLAAKATSNKTGKQMHLLKPRDNKQQNKETFKEYDSATPEKPRCLLHLAQIPET